MSVQSNSVANKIKGGKMGLRIKVLAGALSVALGGCASVDHAREPRPPEVAQAWRAPAPALLSSWGSIPAGSANWWRGFKDEGLSSFVETALESNKGLQASVAATRAAQAINKAAEASVFPQVFASASQTRQRQTADGGSQGLRYSSLGVSSSWEAPLYGQIGLAQSSKQSADAVELYGLDAARSALVYQAVQAYLALKLSSQALVAHQTQERAGELEEKAARAATSAGLSSDQRSESASAQLSRDRAATEQARADQQQAREAMRALAGGQWSALWEREERQPVFAEAIELSLPADTARKRPDVRRAEAAAWLALNAEASARSESLPKLALGGLIQIALGGALPGSPSRAVISAFTPSLSVPLWDWGMAQAKKERARAALDQALALYQESVIQAVREMEGALLEAHRARQARELSQERLLLANKTAERARLDFKAGLISQVEVWESTRALAQERLAAAQAAYAEGLALAFLHKSMASSSWR